jgi:hypothetical protein
MNSFEDVGFISSEIDQFEEKIKKALPSHYTYLHKMNRFSQNIQYKLKIHINDSDELISSILFTRTLSTYQTFILISKRGLVSQAKMLLRCMFEPLFPLVAISKHKDYSKILIGLEEHERLKAFNKLLRFHRRENPEDPLIEEIKAKAKEVKENIMKNNFKKLSIAQIAEDAGLISWYDTAYSLLSNTVHSSVRSLEEALDLDGEKNLRALKNEPSFDEFDHLYATAIEAMLYANIAIANIFKIDIESFINETYNIIKELLEEKV